jgi:catechol 2,3-dioxygenase-like lactoylglutathione lyase family enzyme
MSSTKTRPTGPNQGMDARATDMKLEVVPIPVSDIARAREFYVRLGWRLDLNIEVGDFSAVQLTPPGSGCSIAFGHNMTAAVPGSTQDLYLVVSDIEAARNDLIDRGVVVGKVFHEGMPGARFTCADPTNRVSGPNGSYSTFARFVDPDGNGWLLQEVTTRLPGRLDPNITSFSSASDLANALRRASAAHGEHEADIGETDANWPEWYANYIVSEQAGGAL